VHGGLSSRSDPDLLARLRDLAPGGSRSIAAAVIDMDPEPRTRLALVDASASRRFEIGSITKALTGMLLADAVGRGELSLDTRVGRIVPTCAGTELGSVSLKELATHTSGLPRLPHDIGTLLPALPFVVAGLNPYRGVTPATLFDLAARQRLRGRGRRQYSNLGGAVLGQVLAVATATDYPSLLKERILRPTGLTATAVASQGDCAPRGRSSSGLPRQPWIMDGYAPAGGVYSTIEDMARLATALLGGAAPGIASMTPIDGVATDRPNRRSGLFWIIDEAPETDDAIIWHNGGTGGYSSLFALLPHSRRGVIVLENVAGRSPHLQRIAVGLVK